MEDFIPGKLVYFDIVNKHWTDDFNTAGRCNLEDHAYLYEIIDLSSFPSTNDYKGKEHIVKHGDPCTVLKKIGRPLKLSLHEKWLIYDVYEVLTSSTDKIQVFKYNLKE